MSTALWLTLAAWLLVPAPLPVYLTGKPHAKNLPPLVFVSRQLDPQHGAQVPGLGPRGRMQAFGGRLLVRDAVGRVRPLLPSNAFFDVSDPCVDWDGRRILFAATVAPDAPWRIWMVNADGLGLVQVTRDDRRIDLAPAGFDSLRWGRYDDIDPCWLPSGEICFATTRWPQRAQFDDVAVTNLFITKLDGTPRRTTAERNGAEEPSVDPRNGHVVYARWWFNRYLPSDLGAHGITLDRTAAVPQDTINQWTAVTVAPDGDGIKLAGGDARTRAGLEALQPIVLFDGTLVAAAAENAPLAPGAPGPLVLRAFPGGLAAPRLLAGPGTPTSGSACAPAALPDGRIACSWAPTGSDDWGLYVVGLDGRRFERILDLPGTAEMDVAVLAPRKRPPVAPEEFPDPAGSIPNSRVSQVTDVGTTTFRFDCLNVFTNAAVDAPVPDAPPLQRGLRIRFYSVVTRPQAAGGDSLVFLREVPIDASGAVHVDDILADAPAFEQLVDSEGRVVRSPRGPAHVAGFNFGRLGAGTKCVGCHTGHSTIPVPTNNWRAKWFNAAPSAEVTATSAAGSPRAAVDRRTRGPAEQVAWVANGTRGERIRLSWRTPVEVRAVVLYSVHSEPSEGTNQRIRETDLDFLREGVSVKHLRIRRDLSPKGTRIDCEPVLVDAIEIAPTRVTGLVGRRPVLALAEIEAIARLLED
jgi:hypothetical protein